MKSLKYSCLIATLLFTNSVSAQLEVGVSKADITPLESVPLAGYGGKTRMSQEVIHPICGVQVQQPQPIWLIL